MRTVLRLGAGLLGILFLLIGAGFLLNPTAAAGGFGISPIGNQGLATLRVDMASLFAALGILFAWGSYKADRRALDFAAGLMALALVGRTLSLVLDGTYEGWWQPGLVEVAGLAIAFFYGRSLSASGVQARRDV